MSELEDRIQDLESECAAWAQQSGYWETRFCKSDDENHDLKARIQSMAETIVALEAALRNAVSALLVAHSFVKGETDGGSMTVEGIARHAVEVARAALADTAPPAQEPPPRNPRRNDEPLHP